jgi:hypothetical protein
MKTFVGEEIRVDFENDFILEKKPPCPDSFTWRGATYGVEALVSSWFDHERKGKLARNMRDTHLKRARNKGSWGSGRYYFKILDDKNRIAVLYYDRTPRDVHNKKGVWILFSIEE